MSLKYIILLYSNTITVTAVGLSELYRQPKWIVIIPKYFRVLMDGCQIISNEICISNLTHGFIHVSTYELIVTNHVFVCSSHLRVCVKNHFCVSVIIVCVYILRGLVWTLFYSFNAIILDKHGVDKKKDEMGRQGV